MLFAILNHNINLVPRVLSYLPYGVRKREPWERGCHNILITSTECFRCLTLLWC